MFLDEARLAARIRHPNVVPTLDVVADEQRAVPRHGVRARRVARGASCRALAQRERDPAPASSSPIVLRRPRTACTPRTRRSDETGEPLGIVHRDVSPQNVLVGVDGVARVLDFGVAKAAGRASQTTREGQLKGKLAYMAPEQVAAAQVDRRADVYAAGVVLWELLAGRRLMQASATTACS